MRWTGSLTDCAGRPTAEGLAAISVLASSERFRAMPSLTPYALELRRVAPAAGWTLSSPQRSPAQPTSRTACPAGQRVAARRAEAAVAPRAGRRAPRAPAPPVACEPIPIERDAHTRDGVVRFAHGVRVVHPRLVAMLDEVTRRLPGHDVEIVSGYRPSSDPRARSRHAHARALDYRLAGVSRETLRDVARSLPLAGVGYYPHSVFVHMDVRDAHEGSARWTDYSGHGERPRYGHWPPLPEDVRRETAYVLERAQESLARMQAAEDRREASGATAHDSETETDDAADP